MLIDSDNGGGYSGYDGGGGTPPGDPWTADELAAAQSWAQGWYTQHQIPQSYGTADDLLSKYKEGRQQGKSDADARSYATSILGWDNYTPPVVTPPGGGGGGSGSGSLTAPFTEQFNAPGQLGLPTLGGSVYTIPGAPAVPNLPAFQGPSLEEAMNDPGYQFSEQQGENALKNWQAAHGTFNDSSAAQSLIDYGQNAAQTQYGNVWNRAYQTYQNNLNSQFITPWEMAYQNWQTGTVNPSLQNYQTQYAGVLHQNDMNWQNAWNKWLQDWNIFRDQRDSTFNKQFATATA